MVFDGFTSLSLHEALRAWLPCIIGSCERCAVQTREERSTSQHVVRDFHSHGDCWKKCCDSGSREPLSNSPLHPTTALAALRLLGLAAGERRVSPYKRLFRYPSSTAHRSTVSSRG